MKLRFSINYNTVWGESLHVVIDYLGKDGMVKSHNMRMSTGDGRLWMLETVAVESRSHPVASFRYRYQVEDDDGHVLRSEWDLVPRILEFDAMRDYIIPDEWREIPLLYHLYTKACITANLGRPDDTVQPLRLPIYRRTILFRVSAPQLKPGQLLALCGNHPAIGGWNVSRYLKMQYAGMMEWMLSVNVMGIMVPVEYKYVIVDEKTGELIAWEEGWNRSANGIEVSDGQVLVLDGGIIRVREDIWRVAGVVVPVFSLRSSQSYGVGDFGDLRRMVDWAVATGMKVIQTIPLNDTTLTHGWRDSCPYTAISIYALHPHYVDLEAAGRLRSTDDMMAFNRRRRELNAIGYSDYEAVWRVKSEYLRQLYVEQGLCVVGSAGYKDFVEKNVRWLMPYAVFCLLRDRYSTAVFSEWGEYSVYDEKKVKACCDEHKNEITYIYYIQYLLHKQLKEVGDYARANGVVLKGDIPIGIRRDSVEAWVQPEYFNLDFQTGAPPDNFSYNGQNWLLPTYNWDVMMKDGCRWWRDRLAHMEQYFGAFRIDHALGFFRIWEIPQNAVHGLLGHFYPALPLTGSEIEYFGLKFRKELFTRPFINDRVISKLFGIHADYVRDNFLISKAYGMYELKSECDTQRKVQFLFEGKRDENSLWIRDGLYRLISNVLFVEDPRQHEMYHPRIGAYNDLVFDALNAEDKDAFMRLYNNYFYQRHDMFWGERAAVKLQMLLRGTRMLPCAEDLGMLPQCVGHVLDSLRVLTLEIQSMPKQNGYEFAHLEANPYRSVATISTHDMPPLRLWWEENPEHAQRYYVTMLQKEGHAPEHLPAHIAEEIIARHLYCPSMMCLLSLQDWLAMDSELRSKDIRSERVNIPSDNDNRWKYRMHITIEELLKADKYNQKIKTMIKRSKR